MTKRNTLFTILYLVAATLIVGWLGCTPDDKKEAAKKIIQKAEEEKAGSESVISTAEEPKEESKPTISTGMNLPQFKLRQVHPGRDRRFAFLFRLFGC